MKLEKFTNFIKKLKDLPTKTQAIIACTTVATLVVASVGGVLAYNHFHKPEPVAADTEKAEMVANIDTEEDDINVAINPFQISVPEFLACSVTGESVEKDLNLFMFGADGKKIAGANFTVKLAAPEEAEKLQEAVDAIAEISNQIAELEADEDSSEDEDVIASDKDKSDEEDTISSDKENTELDEADSKESEEQQVENIETYEEAVSQLSEKEQLLLAKREALEVYYVALSAVEGDVYTDDDGDGLIYLTNMTPGDYVACFVPNIGVEASEDEDSEVSEESTSSEESEETSDTEESTSSDDEVNPLDVVTEPIYEPTDYVVSVNVKEKVAYEAIEHVEEKVVDASAAGDTQAAAPPVEAVKENTLEYVESYTEKIPAVYAETTAKALAAFVSSEFSTASANVAQTASASATGVDDGISLCTEVPGDGGTTTYTATLSVPNAATLYSSTLSSLNSAVLQMNAQNISTPISVSSSNGSVSVVDNGNGTYTITTGIVEKDTTATISFLTTLPDGQTLSVACNVTVVGTKSPIFGANGEGLYLDNEGKTTATVADYADGKNFFYVEKEEETKYYGWQNINKIRYYFDKDGNKVTGVQVINGSQYTFGTDGALLTSGYGIDVSKWQGSIDWAQASTAVSFAIVRAGFRGTSGNIAEDPYADRNLTNAKANGVKVGIYFYSRAMNEVQAVEEASLAIAIANRNGGLSLPIYIDMEDSCQLALSQAERDNIVRAFCTTVQNSGYSAGVYANKYWLTNYLTPSSYGGYSIWCAQYNTECTYTGRYDIWQYSSKGSIPGISGNVDMNISYF